MRPLPPSARRWFAIFDRIYRLLLITCPREFRRVYGAQMSQAFRDSCREAHRERGIGGMLRLWPFALIDLAATALAERLTKGVATVQARWTRLGNLVATVTGLCARLISNTSAWIRLGSVATVAASLLWIAYMLLDVANEVFVAVISPPSAVWQANVGVFITHFVAWQLSPAVMLLFLLGIVALRFRLGSRNASPGVGSGRAGALFAYTGLALLFAASGGTAWNIGLGARVCVSARDCNLYDPNGFLRIYGIFGALGLLLLATGLIAMGIATLRVRALPRWNGVPLLLGIFSPAPLAMVMLIALLNLHPDASAVLKMAAAGATIGIIWAVGWFLLGLLLWPPKAERDVGLTVMQPHPAIS